MVQNSNPEQESSMLCRNVAERIEQVTNRIQQAEIDREKRWTKVETTLEHTSELVEKLAKVCEATREDVVELQTKQSDAVNSITLLERLTRIESRLESAVTFKQLVFWLLGGGAVMGTIMAGILSGIWQKIF